MSYADLSLFASYNYNGGGLMMTVMVGRLGGRGKGYAVGVCISMKAWLSYFYCCP